VVKVTTDAAAASERTDAKWRTKLLRYGIGEEAYARWSRCNGGNTSERKKAR